MQHLEVSGAVLHIYIYIYIYIYIIRRLKVNGVTSDYGQEIFSSHDFQNVSEDQPSFCSYGNRVIFAVDESAEA